MSRAHPGLPTALKDRWQEDIIEPEVEVSPQGTIAISDAPGTGYRIREDLIKKLTVREETDRIEPGQEFDVDPPDGGDYRLVRRAALPNEGAIDWLLACPHKDFFLPIDSESTDTL